MSLSCDALLGHELMVSHATCRGCDQGTGVGVLPHTCGLFYSGVGSGGKGNCSDRERLIALFMLFTLGVLFFLLMRELRRGQKVTCVDNNDPSKPSHRLTNGPEPSKTIESDGSNIKKPS